MKKILDIEYNHIYLTEYLSNKTKNKFPIEDYIILFKNKTFYHEIITNILVDDIHCTFSSKEKEIYIKQIENIYPETKIILESSMITYTETIINTINPEKLKTEYFRKDKKQVLFLKDKFKKIPLKNTYQNEKISYTCPLLTTCWYFFRLTENKFKNIDLLNILDKKFLENELNVRYIFQNSTHRELYNKIFYIFI